MSMSAGVAFIVREPVFCFSNICFVRLLLVHKYSLLFLYAIDYCKVLTSLMGGANDVISGQPTTV